MNWTHELLNREPVLRLGFFLGIFALMAAWEWKAGRRPRPLSRARRWPGNLGLTVLNAFMTRLVAPAGAVGFALLAEARGWGLFRRLDGPEWLEILVAVVLLDLTIYLQHRVFHQVPTLWRLHRTHHADVDVDVTTGIRFHPVEILMSLGVKFIVIVGLGFPAVSVLVFEILLNATALFNHSNVRIPPSWERGLRWLVVTPDMHRVHHSIVPRETNSNFGFNLPWWDRLFDTYRPDPAAGHDAMTLGLAVFRNPQEQRLDRLLTQPFREDERPPPLEEK